MSEQKQKTVEVTLAKPHTHAGTKHPAGAKIQVTEPERTWLSKNSIIEGAAGAKAGDK